MADDGKNSWVEFKSGEANVTLPNETSTKLADELSNSYNESSGKLIAQINVASHEQRSTKRSNSSNGNGGRGARVAPKDGDKEVAFTTKKDGNHTTAIDMSDNYQQEFSGDSEALKTGKLLTTVFPTNSHCAWISLPEYDPTKIPKILSHEQVGLPPDTYTNVMKSITGDIRFISYCALYSRVLPVWVMTSIIVLLIVLFSASSNGGFPIMILAFIWMLMLLLGIMFGIIIRKHLAVALRQCVKDLNHVTLQKNLLVGVQDRGQLSCHKMVVLFIYYEITGCQKDVARLLQVHETSSVNLVVSEAIAALKKSAQISPEENSGRLTEDRASQLAYKMLLDHSQQYVKAYMKEFFNRTHKRTWYERLK